MGHTPGPWKITTITCHPHQHIETCAFDTTICSMADHQGAEGEANANLIVSAPEMLEALKDTTEALGLYLASVEDGKDDDAESAYQHAVAIIAKAEGKKI